MYLDRDLGPLVSTCAEETTGSVRLSYYNPAQESGWLAGGWPSTHSLAESPEAPASTA